MKAITKHLFAEIPFPLVEKVCNCIKCLNTRRSLKDVSLCDSIKLMHALLVSNKFKSFLN